MSASQKYLDGERASAIEQQQFLTPDEAAVILRVTTRTIYQWLRTGKIIGQQFGPRLWRIPASSIGIKGIPNPSFEL